MSAADERAGAALGVRRMADETRERFVREILARVPVERVVEVHCFTPIRQGGVETGVAVVAATPPIAEAGEPPRAGVGADAAPVADAGAAPAVASAPAEPTPELAAEAQVPPPAAACDPTDDAAGPAPTADDDAPSAAASDALGTEDTAVRGAPAVVADAVGAEPAAAAAGGPPPGPGDDDAALPTASMDEVLIEDVPVDVEAAPAPRQPWPRHTIFTARYRLTLKGPDRGRWVMDVVEEADAPLVTVAAVVRGVQRRAGDAADAERLAAADVAAIAARAAAPPFPGARGGSAR